MLRRGPAAVKPEKSVRPPAARDKTDAAHPLRGGKQRKIKFAKRPSRSKGTDAWRARQIDEHQDAMLRKAYGLYRCDAERLSICKWQRRGTDAVRRHHADLPLKMRKRAELKCSESCCHCKPNYILLVGKLGGIGTGEPAFVRGACP